jgi:hypothetical protein
MHRPTQHVDEERQSPPARRGRNRSNVGVVAALIVVVAVVVGILLTRGGSGTDTHTEGSPSVEATDQLVVPAERPDVAAEYVASSHEVVFTWSYTNAEPGDYFQAASEPGATPKTLHVARLVIATTDPQKTCLVVAVFRATTNQGSDYSDPTCGLGH